MRAIDFFCGAGGLTRGLLDAGIEVVAGLDADESCRKTYEENNRPARFIARDIAKVTRGSVWKLLGSRATTDLLVTGCAPCQPFSQHRKHSEKKSADNAKDSDATLLGAFARVVEELLPGQVLVENVPGLVRVPGFSTYRRFLKMLTSRGYKIAEGIVDAKRYGVPQTRRRYVLVAVRGKLATLPKASFGSDIKPYLTVRDAIAHFPPISAGARHPMIANHEAASLSQMNLKRLRLTPSNGGDRRSWPYELKLDCHSDDYDGHTDVYGRMSWDKPAPTLTGKCHSISNGRYGHPSQDRAISLREAASLQTFGDSYVFFGFRTHIAQHIGNAVPVKLAESLGAHLIQIRTQNCGS
jgi:DNA (cytosine-5)-methyltransferase 1